MRSLEVAARKNSVKLRKSEGNASMEGNATIEKIESSFLEIEKFILRMIFVSFICCLRNSTQTDSRDPLREISRDPSRDLLSGLKEYCQSEFFNATCSKNEVILVESARYGRMRSGRCITGSYGYLGCSNDVIWYLHRKCSGRGHCRVHTMDPVLHATQPCPKDLASYLEASYRCVTATTDEKQTCLTRGYMEISTSVADSTHPLAPFGSSSSSSGYLSSLFASERGQGTKDCPWHITTDQGQRIRIILVAFGGSRHHQDSGDLSLRNQASVDVCFEVGTIVESLKTIPLKACTTSGPSEFKSSPEVDSMSRGSLVVFLSEVNNITVFIHAKHVLKELSEFLFKYEAIGCPTLLPPPGGWLKSESDSTRMGCNNQLDTWHLTCVERAWIGQIPNCTMHQLTDSNTEAIVQEEAEEAEDAEDEDAVAKFPLAILFVVAIGVSLGVFMGGILLSIVSLIMKRKGRKHRFEAAQKLPEAPPPGLTVDTEPNDDVTETMPRHIMTCSYRGDSGYETSLNYSKIARMTSCPEHYKLECCGSAQHYRSFASCTSPPQLTNLQFVGCILPPQETNLPYSSCVTPPHLSNLQQLVPTHQKL